MSSALCSLIVNKVWRIFSQLFLPSEKREWAEFEIFWAYRSDSSAACEASANFCVAVASLSSDLSKSSSRSWMRRFKAATSPSACNVQDKNFIITLFSKSGFVIVSSSAMSFHVKTGKNEVRTKGFTSSLRLISTPSFLCKSSASSLNFSHSSLVALIFFLRTSRMLEPCTLAVMIEGQAQKGSQTLRENLPVVEWLYSSAFFRISGSSDGSNLQEQLTVEEHTRLVQHRPKRECVNDESWVQEQLPSRISLVYNIPYLCQFCFLNKVQFLLNQNNDIFRQIARYLNKNVVDILILT